MNSPRYHLRSEELDEIDTTYPLINIEVFLPYIEPEVPTCPLPTIELYLRRALVTSCEDVPLWRWQHPEIPAVKGQSHFRFQTPVDQSNVHSILMATFDGRDIHTCAGYSVPDRGRLSLVDPSQYDTDPFDAVSRRRTGLVAFLSIKPSEYATEVPELLFREYQDMIVAQTLTRLFALTNREWTDFNASVAYGRTARAKQVEARQAIDRGMRHGSLKVSAPSFITERT